MNIYLNGEVREVPQNLTLTGLLEWLKLPTDRVAVELNRGIVSRSKWEQTAIQSEDRLEVVHFVGGGSSDFPLAPGERGEAPSLGIGNKVYAPSYWF
jgi:thiamine biosynthesis protein ThiS